MSISNKHNPLKKAIRLAIFASVAASLAVIPNVYAAEDEVDEDENTVTITGSRIKRTDDEGVSPVQVITKEDLEISGLTTMQDFVRTLTTSAGNTADDNTNSFANGTSTLNLRGLGNNATLVLINGKRVASYGQGQNITESFVDLNSIPFALVERIEILKDGGSALYGADAVAGVVNIILRTDYEGGEVSIGRSSVLDSNSDTSDFTVTIGGSNEKTSFVSSLSYFDRTALFSTEREFSRTADHRRQGGYDFRSSRGMPGTIYGDGVGLIPHPSCSPEALNPSWLCRFNYNEFINLYPASTRFSSSNFLTHELTDNMELKIDLSVGRNKTTNIAAPAPWFGPYGGLNGSQTVLTDDQRAWNGSGGWLYMSADNPYNPYGEQLSVLHRTVAFGPRTGVIRSNSYRFVSSIEGLIFDDWDYDIGYTYTRNDIVTENQNNVDGVKLQELFIGTPVDGLGNSLWYNPFSLQQDPGVLEYAAVNWIKRDTSWEEAFTANFSGTLTELDGGPLGLAVGIEVREQYLSNEADTLRNVGGFVGGGASSNTFGKRDITSIYAELAIPVGDMVEIQVAARYEDYSDFGTTTKPKVGIKFQPMDSLALRASYSESFRAPSLVELFSGAVTSFPSGLIDPARCPSPGDPAGVNGNVIDLAPKDCGNGQHRVSNGGNQLLQPEESEAVTFGVVWEPMEELTLVFDYFKFDHDNIIISFPLTTRLAENDPNFVIRSGGLTSPIIEILNGRENGAGQEVSGIDFELMYNVEIGPGLLTVKNQLTYYNTYEFTTLSGTVVEGIGTATLGAFPEKRDTLSTSYNVDDHTFAALVHYRSGVTANNPNSITGEDENSGAHVTFDLTYIWNAPLGRVQVGCINCSDKAPAFDTSSTSGAFSSLDNISGVTAYVRYSHEF